MNDDYGGLYIKYIWCCIVLINGGFCIDRCSPIVAWRSNSRLAHTETGTWRDLLGIRVMLIFCRICVGTAPQRPDQFACPELAMSIHRRYFLQEPNPWGLSQGHHLQTWARMLRVVASGCIVFCTWSNTLLHRLAPPIWTLGFHQKLLLQCRKEALQHLRGQSQSIPCSVSDTEKTVYLYSTFGICWGQWPVPLKRPIQPVMLKPSLLVYQPSILWDFHRLRLSHSSKKEREANLPVQAETALETNLSEPSSFWKGILQIH